MHAAFFFQMQDKDATVLGDLRQQLIVITKKYPESHICLKKRNF